MMDARVNWDRAGMANVARQFPVAASRAVNKTVKMMRTQAKTIVRAEFNIKAADVTRSLKIDARAKPGNISARLIGWFQGIPLKRFGATWKQSWKGTKVQVVKGKRVMIAHAFAPDSLNKQVFMRTGKQRLPIIKKFGPTVAQVIGKKERADRLVAFAVAKLPDVFRHEVEYFLSTK